MERRTLQILKSIESEYNDTLDNLRVSNTESKNRKIKIRELEPQLEDLRDKVELMETNPDKTEMETKLKSLEEFKSGYLKTQRTTFVSELGKITQHPNWEKASGRFVLPETKEGEEMDINKLTDEQLESNIKNLADLHSLGYFDSATGTPKPKLDGNRFQNIDNDREIKIDSRSKLQEYLKQGFEAGAMESD